MLNLEQCTVSEPVKRMLDTMFVQKRVPQALIIEGDHTRTTELARVLASGLVCQSQDNKPCGTCSSCIKAHAGSHPDIYLAEGGLTPRSFRVEAIRAIRSDAYIQSQEGGCKVYLLFRAESMSAEAQNALLKVLEEPPADTVFILTCLTANRLLQTIRSRSQIITLEDAVEENSEAVRIAGEIVQALIHTKEIEILQATAPLIKDKDLLKEVLNQLTLIFRDACVQRAGGNSYLSTQTEQVNALCRAIPKAKLFQLGQVVTEIQTAMVFNANMTILVTMLCAKLRTEAGR